MTTSEIPTETLTGSVIRQLYRGEWRLVFVEDVAVGEASRSVCEVFKISEGEYKPIGTRRVFHGDGSEDAMEIAALYLGEPSTRCL